MDCMLRFLGALDTVEGDWYTQVLVTTDEVSKAWIYIMV